MQRKSAIANTGRNCHESSVIKQLHITQIDQVLKYLLKVPKLYSQKSDANLYQSLNPKAVKWILYTIVSQPKILIMQLYISFRYF